MKRFIIVWVAILALFYLVNPAGVFACDPTKSPSGCATSQVCRALDPTKPTTGTCEDSNTIRIGRPTADVDGKTKNVGYTDISNFISNIVTIAFIVAIIVVLVMLILGAYEWIVSGGDKEAVGKARNRIVNALIGLAVLAVAFALANLGAQVLGFPSLTDKITLPTPQ